MKGLLKWILTIIVAIVIWIAILIAYFIILSIIVSGQTTNNLGRITSTNALAWDFDTNDVITGFKVYVRHSTNMVEVFTAPTNRWQGATNKSLKGWHPVYVTAVSVDEESLPSETVLVYFTGGRPSNPSNIQLYSMTTFVATNALPRLNLPPLPP